MRYPRNPFQYRDTPCSAHNLALRKTVARRQLTCHDWSDPNFRQAYCRARGKFGWKVRVSLLDFIRQGGQMLHRTYQTQTVFQCLIRWSYPRHYRGTKSYALFPFGCPFTGAVPFKLSTSLGLHRCVGCPRTHTAKSIGCRPLSTRYRRALLHSLDSSSFTCTEMAAKEIFYGTA